MDRIAEVYLGQIDGRFNIDTTESVKVADLKTSDDVKQYILGFIKYFNSYDLSADLNNIREESIADCNRFIYLQSLK